jgi:hypothetical protein
VDPFTSPSWKINCSMLDDLAAWLLKASGRLCSFLHTHRSSRRVNELEDVVLDEIVASLCTLIRICGVRTRVEHTLLKLESLDVAHGLWRIINHKGASDHNEDCTRFIGRLSIGGVDAVLDLLERQFLRAKSAWWF